MRLAIFGALPRELKYVVKGLGATKSPEEWSFPAYGTSVGGHAVTIVQTGMGMSRSMAALHSVTDKERPDVVVSLGFCGALYEQAIPGEVVLGGRILLLPVAGEGPASISSALREATPRQPLPAPLTDKLGEMADLRKGSIITLDQHVKKTTVAERIPRGLPYPVCDMETFGIAEACLRMEIAFLAVRAVSDVLREEVPPELVGVVDEAGQPNLGRLFHAVTTNPALVTDVLRLRKSSETAARNLGRLTEQLFGSLP